MLPKPLKIPDPNSALFPTVPEEEGGLPLMNGCVYTNRATYIWCMEQFYGSLTVLQLMSKYIFMARIESIKIYIFEIYLITWGDGG